MLTVMVTDDDDNGGENVWRGILWTCIIHSFWSKHILHSYVNVLFVLISLKLETVLFLLF